MSLLLEVYRENEHACVYILNMWMYQHQKETRPNLCYLKSLVFLYLFYIINFNIGNSHTYAHTHIHTYTHMHTYRERPMKLAPHKYNSILAVISPVLLLLLVSHLRPVCLEPLLQLNLITLVLLSRLVPVPPYFLRHPIKTCNRY